MEIPFHTAAYYIRKAGGPGRVSMFVFDIGEGHADATKRHAVSQRSLHRFYRGLGWWRLLAYSIGYLIGAAQTRRSTAPSGPLDLADDLGIWRSS